MNQKYVTGLRTVFGLRLAPRLSWRERRHQRALRDAWQQAARTARTPIIHTATDENCPLAQPHADGVDPERVIKFIDENFNLQAKTGGAGRLNDALRLLRSCRPRPQQRHV